MLRTLQSRCSMLGVTVLLALASASPSSPQATGTTSIDINFPGLVALWHYDSVDDDRDAAGPVWSAAVADPSGSTPDVGIIPASLLDPVALTLTLRSSWAVLSFSSSGSSTQVEVNLVKNKLEGPEETAGIRFSALQAQSPNSGGYGDPITIPATGFDMAKLEVGDLRMKLNVVKAMNTGTYSGGNLEITVSNL